MVDFQLLFLRHGFHIGIFHKTDDLHPRGLMMLKITGKLKRRPVDVRLCDLDSLHVDLRRQIFQLHLRNNLGKIYMRHSILSTFRCFSPPKCVSQAHEKAVPLSPFETDAVYLCLF